MNKDFSIANTPKLPVAFSLSVVKLCLEVVDRNVGSRDITQGKETALAGHPKSSQFISWLLHDLHLSGSSVASSASTCAGATPTCPRRQLKLSRSLQLDSAWLELQENWDVFAVPVKSAPRSGESVATAQQPARGSTAFASFGTASGAVLPKSFCNIWATSTASSFQR